VAVFVISYDLNKQKDYQKLWHELKRLGCVRALESVWVGALTGTARTVLSHLSQFVDVDDSLVVAETDSNKLAFKRPFEGTLEWIASRRA